MLERADFIRIALGHDTTMSRAMLRACRYPAPEPWPKPGTKICVEDIDKYADIVACFRNDESPMDGRAL